MFLTYANCFNIDSCSVRLVTLYLLNGGSWRRICMMKMKILPIHGSESITGMYVMHLISTFRLLLLHGSYLDNASTGARWWCRWSYHIPRRIWRFRSQIFSKFLTFSLWSPWAISLFVLIFISCSHFRQSLF